MPYVKSLKHLEFATTNGYGLCIPPKTPTWVPPPALRFALDKGAVECDDKGTLLSDCNESDDPSPLKDVPVIKDEELDDDAKRHTAIVAAIKYLYEVGNAKDFRKDNFPKVASLERALGFTPTGEEVATAFGEYQSK